jgi:hypothetical protein
MPPIAFLFGTVTRPGPITIAESRLANSRFELSLSHIGVREVLW